MSRLKLAIASARSAILTIIAMTVVIIVSEVSTAFNDFLKSISGHHWRTKSYLTVLLFVVLTLIFRAGLRKDPNETAVVRVLRFLILTTILCVVVVTGFFVYLYQHE